MTDTERVAWLETVGDVDISIIRDAEHDGEVLVRVNWNIYTYGKTLRAAIDKAMEEETI